jgi:hypothetical protein
MNVATYFTEVSEAFTRASSIAPMRWRSSIIALFEGILLFHRKSI